MADQRKKGGDASTWPAPVRALAMVIGVPFGLMMLYGLVVGTWTAAGDVWRGATDRPSGECQRAQRELYEAVQRFELARQESETFALERDLRIVSANARRYTERRDAAFAADQRERQVCGRHSLSAGQPALPTPLNRR